MPFLAARAWRAARRGARLPAWCEAACMVRGCPIARLLARGGAALMRRHSSCSLVSAARGRRWRAVVASMMLACRCCAARTCSDSLAHAYCCLLAVDSRWSNPLPPNHSLVPGAIGPEGVSEWSIGAHVSTLVRQEAPQQAATPRRCARARTRVGPRACIWQQQQVIRRRRRRRLNYLYLGGGSTTSTSAQLPQASGAHPQRRQIQIDMWPAVPAAVGRALEPATCRCDGWRLIPAMVDACMLSHVRMLYIQQDIDTQTEK